VESFRVNATVNGQVRAIEGGVLADLLAELHIPAQGTAVAVNDRVVPKAQYATHQLCEGDRIEIIVAVAGG
jgi:sulfur carrier protein